MASYDSALPSVDLISAIKHLEILAFILFPVYCILYFGTYCYKKIWGRYWKVLLRKGIVRTRLIIFFVRNAICWECLQFTIDKTLGKIIFWKSASLEINESIKYKPYKPCTSNVFLILYLYSKVSLLYWRGVRRIKSYI